MKIIDLNILIYAVNSDAPNHKKAYAWWEQILSETETIGLSWSVILGFLRITTNQRIMQQPLTHEQAIDILQKEGAEKIITIFMSLNVPEQSKKKVKQGKQ